MTTTLRINDELKAECDEVFEAIGVNLSCAITIFLKEVARSRSIPFPLRAGERMGNPSASKPPLCERIRVKRELRGLELEAQARRGIKAFNALRQESQEEMSLADINAEIAAMRRERSRKEPI
ncbi:MAG: type II toxin-antitoxin system RelB/DinJ family antitoxin [Kiritimatiellia bacterium]